MIHVVNLWSKVISTWHVYSILVSLLDFIYSIS